MENPPLSISVSFHILFFCEMKMRIVDKHPVMHENQPIQTQIVRGGYLDGKMSHNVKYLSCIMIQTIFRGFKESLRILFLAFSYRYHANAQL